MGAVCSAVLDSPEQMLDLACWGKEGGDSMVLHTGSNVYSDCSGTVPNLVPTAASLGHMLHATTALDGLE